MTWDEALDSWRQKSSRQPVQNLVTLAGGRLSNEDLFNLRQLTASKARNHALYSLHGWR